MFKPDDPELRVLVVDDNVDAATSLAYLFQLLNRRTSVAFGGSMALRVAQLFQPGLVVLDLEMPGADGCEVLAEIRALGGKLSSATFVCLTGRDDEETKSRCLAAGFGRFVSKPISPEQLRSVLEEALTRMRAAPDGSEAKQWQ